MKTLTLVPIGGLANRFYAITSAIASCKDYNVKLKVIWFKDKGMDKDSMLENLQRLRGISDSRTEDILLELMDFVDGYCNRNLSIYDSI